MTLGSFRNKSRKLPSWSSGPIGRRAHQEEFWHGLPGNLLTQPFLLYESLPNPFFQGEEDIMDVWEVRNNINPDPLCKPTLENYLSLSILSWITWLSLLLDIGCTYRAWKGIQAHRECETWHRCRHGSSHRQVSQGQRLSHSGDYSRVFHVLLFLSLVQLLFSSGCMTSAVRVTLSGLNEEAILGLLHRPLLHCSLSFLHGKKGRETHLTAWSIQGIQAPTLTKFFLDAKSFSGSLLATDRPSSCITAC